MQPCGTQAAYTRHIRHGETPCQPCRDAHTERYREQAKKYRSPEIRPGKFCQRCSGPIPRGRSKFCSDVCLLTYPSANDRCRIWHGDCVICGKPFVARHPRTVMCGAVCSETRRRTRANRSDDYRRWKRNKRRTVTRDSDITPAQEGQLRRRTRKCKLCGVFMTSKAFQPNSKELDHIVPVGMGGTHTHGNVRIICRLCNLKRPKDGSDYTGPVTLWATAPGISITAKPKPVPKPPKPLRPTARCACGMEFIKVNVKHYRCHDCTAELGRQAAKLRSQGWVWNEITKQLGYFNTGNLLGYAVRHGGYVPARRGA